jgi:hypothetical protein
VSGADFSTKLDAPLRADSAMDLLAFGDAALLKEVKSAVPGAPAPPAARGKRSVSR